MFKYSAAKNTGMRIGWIYNKSRGVPEDKIRMQIKSMSGFWDLNFRLDEAAAVIMGISKVLAIESIAGNIKAKL